MNRRDLITLLGGAALAWPLGARAQQKTMPVIGFLDATEFNPVMLEAFRKGLAEAGYDEGRNVVIRHQNAAGHYDRLPPLAAELVRDRVSLILAPTLPGVLATKAATATIPIVFMLGADPIKQGLVASLNRPGGNATGLSMLTAGLDAKRLQVLRDLVPDIERFGLLFNPSNPNAELQVSETQAAARAMVRKIDLLEAGSDGEIEAAFAALAERRIGALLVGADPFLTSRVQQIVDLAERNRVPAVYEWREFVDAGGLASYGSSRTDNQRILGVYAGKILAGAKPADLPVMQPTRFELVINLKTAKALGLTVPSVLLAGADEVIE